LFVLINKQLILKKMKKLETLKKFAVANDNATELFGGAPVKTYSDCTNYSYNTNNELCDSKTTRTDDNGGTTIFEQNHCTA
jgi:hypothetical protein